ncbi:MAG: tRNA lysidine(34) synthetase TilS [Planctomycetota bacterium]|nr:tRNA lysidine(34) synthetase TilS [Planctomycetota bacterium]
MNSQTDASRDVASHVATWWRNSGCKATAVLVGVSGGADSVGLLRAVAAEGGLPDVKLVVGHVDHGIRGAGSQADLKWVGELAGQLGLEYESTTVDLQGDHSEASARESRYAALMDAAERNGCGAIMVAHTRDDQVETVLHNLLRGTGLKGVAGMSERKRLGNGLELLRPILDLRRADVENWLRSVGQSWRDDHTNTETRWTRNRIRHELLPVLEREYNPQVREALLRMSRLSSEAVGIVREVVEAEWGRCVLEQSESVVRLCVDSLNRLQEPLVRALLLEIWSRQGWRRQAMSYSHWQNLARTVTVGTALDLPGGVAARRNGRVARIERTKINGG